MTTNNYLIYGAGGHAKVLKDLIEKMNLEVNAFFDDSNQVHEVKGIKVHPYDTSFSREKPLILGIGNPRVRKLLSEKVEHGYSTLIHPDAVVASDAIIEEGTVVLAGAVIQSGAYIGKHVIINSNVTIDHDAVVGDFVTTYPGVYVGAEAVVGEGAVINPNSVVMRFSQVPSYYEVGPMEVVNGKL